MKKKEEMLRDDTPITYETVSRMYMRPGLSNVDIYINGPEQVRPNIEMPTSVSAGRRGEYGDQISSKKKKK